MTMSLGTSKEYLEIKKMMWNEPKLLHSMLEKLAENIGEYANYQIKSGAQVIQVFDSWAGNLFFIIIFYFFYYANYQIKSGAQVIQVFDSWAGNLYFYFYFLFFLLCQLPNLELGEGSPGFRLLGW
jgi:uroporphyrinogen-III decarboxylase